MNNLPKNMNIENLHYNSTCNKIQILKFQVTHKSYDKKTHGRNHVGSYEIFLINN